MNNNEIENIINLVSKKTGVNKDKFKNVSNENDVKNILNSMDSKNSQKLKAVLDNPEATKKILASKKAQDLLNKIFSS